LEMEILMKILMKTLSWDVVELTTLMKLMKTLEVKQAMASEHADKEQEMTIATEQEALLKTMAKNLTRTPSWSKCC